MTGPEHYKEAERLLDQAARHTPTTDHHGLIAMAHVRAQLAQTAVMALQAPIVDAIDGPAGISQEEYNEWHAVAG